MTPCSKTARLSLLACILCIPSSSGYTQQHTWRPWRRNNGNACSRRATSSDRTIQGAGGRRTTLEAFAGPFRVHNAGGIAGAAHAIPYRRSAVSRLPCTSIDSSGAGAADEAVDPAESPSLFIFGVGYVATAVALAFKRQGWTVYGTCTDPRKVKSLGEQGIKVSSWGCRRCFCSPMRREPYRQHSQNMYSYTSCVRMLSLWTDERQHPPP